MNTRVQKSACNLCSINCGIEIEVNLDTREFVKITGDKDHPRSQGYICQKATRLNYYQNNADRLTTPLKKTKDGSFIDISWEQAIQEIADKLVSTRDTYGGTSIAYAGGGGQGNHLGGAYASALRAACRTPYIYSSLAQEKTGNFWVHGKLFGRQNVMYDEPIDEAEYVIFLGTNPMQSHGFPRARRVIGELSRDPNRTMVVIDPCKNDTAKKADLFLQVIPGRDAWLLAAMLGILVQEDLVDHEFIKDHTTGYDSVANHLSKIPVAEYAEISGVPLADVQKVARGVVAAKTMVLRSDLGIEMSYNSTLNAYLSRLLFLVTGHFGKKGTNHLTTWFFPLLGHSKDPEAGGMTSKVTKTRGIGKLYPPNILPQEIDSDHPNRVRALIVDSANPLVNWADSNAQRKAYKKLDLMVVIDIAMTETAREAHYILPASSQYEKYEAAFFTENFFHLRAPALEPLEGTLSEPEIYSRILKAMGEYPEDLEELKSAAKEDFVEGKKGSFQQAFMQASFTQPNLKKYGPMVLRDTVGQVMDKGAESAGLIWFTSQMYANKYPESVKLAGISGDQNELGDKLFEKIVASPSGINVGERNIEDHWDLVKTPDNKVHLDIPEMLSWMDNLPQTLHQIETYEKAYPFNLIAGERRAYNANTILRNPEWRKKDAVGVLKINSEDASEFSIEEGDSVELTSRAGSIRIVTSISDEVPRGVMSMPHGQGLIYDGKSDYKSSGAMVNNLTSVDHCDPLAKTPYHKNVRVKLRKLEAEIA